MAAHIQVALHHGVHVIRLSGDVRLHLCSALENYLDDILSKANFENVLIDLSHTSGIDSTALGQMAKISILCRERFGLTPIIASPNPQITEILMSMGFDQVFHIIQESFINEAQFEDWVAETWTEDEAREQVISAHKALMSLNEKNNDEFRDLVDALESGCGQSGSARG
ncbi:MAG: STAS domain-containing protein [Venatoribacter sp.]